MFFWYLLCGIIAAIVMRGFITPILQVLTGCAPPLQCEPTAVKRVPTARELRRRERDERRDARREQLAMRMHLKSIERAQWQQRTGSSRLASLVLYRP